MTVVGTDEIERRRHKAEMLAKTRERRLGATGALEIRSAGVGSPTLTLTGLACRTNVWYEVGDPARGGYFEMVVGGAFRRTLSESPDTVLNIQHGGAGTGLPLARTTAGTLRLEESQRGLEVSADLDALDPEPVALQRKLDRGDLDGQMSFAFLDLTPVGKGWNEDFTRRRITCLTLARGDVSIVVYGANEATEAEIRAQRQAAASSSHGRHATLPDYTTRAAEEHEEYLLLTRAGRRPVAPTLVDPLAQARADLACWKRGER